MGILSKGSNSETTGERDYESLASSGQLPAKPRAIQGSVFDGLRLGDSIAPCAVDGYRGFDEQREKNRKRKTRDRKAAERSVGIINFKARLPSRTFNLPMIWATDEALRNMRSDCDKEIKCLKLHESLLELASEHNGLTAILHELELRTP